MTERLDRAMSRAEAMLVELQTATDDAVRIALQFGDDVGEIGRELTLHPELAPEVFGFVGRTAPIVARDTGLMFWIHRVYDRAESRSSETYEYVHALTMRSALEFFRELYRDSVAGHAVAGIETEELDQNLKEWGAVQYLEEVPAGYPASHVWWHQSLSGK